MTSRKTSRKEGLGLGLASKPKWKVSVSSRSRGKLVRSRSRLDQTFKRLGLVSVSKEKVSFTSLIEGFWSCCCSFLYLPLEIQVDCTGLCYPAVKQESTLN